MRRTILIVNKDQTGVEQYMESLKSFSHGYHCRFANNVDRALRILRHYFPGVMFLHEDEEGSTGLKMLAYIKSDDKLRSIRVFLCATCITDEVNKMAQSLGASGCIEATNDRNTFLRQLKAILNPELLPGYVLFSRQTSHLLLRENITLTLDNWD